MRRLISKEAKMVEKSHTAGWFPSLYEPFRQIGEKVSEWFAPKSEASALEDCYEINMELPGVKIDDVSITMQNDALVVHGKKHFEHQETGQSFYFPNGNTVPFKEHSDFHPMPAGMPLTPPSTMAF
jgi:HSP20 family molecular chaperone IbpA